MKQSRIPVIACAVITLGLGVTGSMTAQARELTPAEKRIVSAEVAQRLKDPSVAQFKWPAATLKGSPTGGVYCGYVNAKNSFGAYTGFAPFYGEVALRNGSVTSFSVIKIESPESDTYSREMARTTAELCRAFGVGM